MSCLAMAWDTALWPWGRLVGRAVVVGMDFVAFRQGLATGKVQFNLHGKGGLTCMEGAV